MHLGKRTVIDFPSKKEVLRVIGHNISMALDTNKSNFGNQKFLRFHIVHYGTLLQNVTNIITKCDSYFITKCFKGLLQNATVLFQNATFITKCEVHAHDDLVMILFN